MLWDQYYLEYHSQRSQDWTGYPDDPGMVAFVLSDRGTL